MPDLSPRFPLAPTVPVEGTDYPAGTVLSVLDGYLSDERRARIEAVVAARTFSVVPVLEGLVDAGNVNAVLRSAEGLGCGAAHLVALGGGAARLAEATLDPDGDPDEALAGSRRVAARASQGADKWLELTAYPDVASYLEAVRELGYRVAVTALRAEARPIASYDFSRPTALVVGNEQAGVSEALLDVADDALLLPLDGFVQSYNVSVAAALALYHARADRTARGGHGDLSGDERRVLTAHYVARAVPHAAALLRHAA